MIRIEVKSIEVHVKSGVSARTGKPYSIPEQDGWAYTTDKEGKLQPFPQRIVLVLKQDQQPYSVGNYTIAPASFYVDRFNGLSLGLVLQPVQQPAQVAKAA